MVTNMVLLFSILFFAVLLTKNQLQSASCLQVVAEVALTLMFGKMLFIQAVSDL